VAEAGAIRWVDAYVLQPLPPTEELLAHLPDEWREYVGRPGSLPDGGGARPVHSDSPFRSAVRVPHQDGALPPSAEREGQAERGVLVQELGLSLSAQPNPYLALQVARAANDWLAERYLTGSDERLYGAVVVPNQVPAQAAQEIRRIGVHPRMVAVLLSGSGLGRPFGNALYDPIHAAAAELGLPIMIHAAGDAVIDGLAHPTGAGPPSTYGELKAMAAQPLMTHTASLVAQGTFEKHPALRVLLVGGGMSWLPGLTWRLDTNYKGMRRETPWVTRLPSEYIHEHIRLTTYPLDTRTDSAGLRRALAAFDGFEDLLCYASGYPNADWDRPAETAAAVPDSWREQVLRRNAARLFGFTGIE
jgi:predicted TIM-barrel fold metal-dependent hydrolase